MAADYLSTNRTYKRPQQDLARLAEPFGARVVEVNGKPVHERDTPHATKDALDDEYPDSAWDEQLTFWSIRPVNIRPDRKIDFVGSLPVINGMLLWTMFFFFGVIVASQLFINSFAWLGFGTGIYLLILAASCRTLRDRVTVSGRFPPITGSSASAGDELVIAHDFLAKRFGIGPLETKGWVNVTLSVKREEIGRMLLNPIDETLYRSDEATQPPSQRDVARWQVGYNPHTIAAVRQRVTFLPALIHALAAPLVFTAAVLYLVYVVPFVSERFDYSVAVGSFLAGMGFILVIPAYGAIAVTLFAVVRGLWRWLTCTSYRNPEESGWLPKHWLEHRVQLLPHGSRGWITITSSHYRDEAALVRRSILADIRQRPARFD